MDIKTKLYAGLGFLALLVILLWSSGLIFINTLANNSSAIIENNKRTVSYMQNMEQALTSLHLQQTELLNDKRMGRSSDTEVDSLKRFFKQEMEKQQGNITENGEAEISDSLESTLMQYLEQFERLRSLQESDMDLYQSATFKFGEVQDLLAEITYMNLEAIQQKNDRAQKTASNVIWSMTSYWGFEYVNCAPAVYEISCLHC